MTMPSPPEIAVSPVPHPRRTTFRVHLNSNVPAEINFKDLMVQSTNPSKPPTPSISSLNATSNSLPSTGKPELIAPIARPQRFNIIEHLEKRYGGGSVLNDGHGNNVGGPFLDRRDDDDLYDSEDSFIDDVELQQNIKDARDQVKVKTKHAGFFVSAGDEIETLEKEEEEEDGENVGKSKRDVVSEWQPNEEVVKRLEVLRTAVEELAETTPIPKVFPRSLDEPLRAVDKRVVEAHPNKWRVTGYFATLMTFLPYTKQYLKSNMLRLEARDVAKHKREKLDSAFETLTQIIAVYGVRAAAEPADVIKEEISKDKELGTMLHALLELQDEWVSKENDYRQMLKTEDKKHMNEPDFKPLNQRQERNRMYNRVVALFTPGLTDLQTLRALNKAAKAKTPKKSAPVKGAATVAKKKCGEPTYGATISVKRSIKPFKSRMMDDVLFFEEADFEDVEQ